MSLVIQPRINDRNVIQQIRQESGGLCEYVDPVTGQRCNQWALGEPHHIKTRGAGGDDIRENLIHLCGVHHVMFHDGNINRHHLIEVVAKREEKTVEEVYNILKLPLPENIEPINWQEQEPSMEELIQAYIQLDEHEQEARWAKGQLLDLILKAGASQKWLSAQIGISPAQIRELVKVYRTFPEESMRIPSLSWYHHRVAANSNKPHEYLAKANDEHLSTRELRKLILADEGKEHINQDEEKSEMKKAKKLFAELEEMLNKGGEPANWLKEQLQVFIFEKGGV